MFTGDASFSGTSSSGLFVAVMTASSLVIPFCNTLASLDNRFVTVVEVVLDVDFDVRVFFVGEVAEAFPDDFPVDVRVFAMPVAVPIGTEERALVLGTDAPEREICLLTVSLLCLSINGDFPVAVIVLLSRGLVVPPEVGAVLGRDAPLTPVVGCFNVDADLVAKVADMGLGFDVTLDVDVFVAVDVLTSVFAVVLVVVVLTVVLAGFVVAGLLANFVSPLTVDFFSIDAGVLTFNEVVVVVVVFGLVADRGEALVLVAVVLLGSTVVFVVVVLPLALETVVLVDPSNCLGRVAVLVAVFFKVNCDAGKDVVVVRMVVLIALEGEVGDFVAAFVVVFVTVVFVGRFALVVVVVFAFELAMTTAAAVATTAASTDTCATSVSFDLSIVAISSRTSTVFCNSTISSCFGGIFSEVISSFNTSSSTLADTNSAAFSSICSCLIDSLVSIVIGTDSSNIWFSCCSSSSIKLNLCIESDGINSVVLSGLKSLLSLSLSSLHNFSISSCFLLSKKESSLYTSQLKFSVCNIAFSVLQ
ncbi:hypothetical protein ALC56_05402 [Trachymyrmex septentrionalis]|uniref:Uncharacterized protein n=1 Tax=Trachymyrmex septentrionalis TaxID=34720 RepID=A0A195FJM2_9HYME|nr:hypothetical protein ALC56_05402 [Trachymyrmex septentrionalis]